MEEEKLVLVFDDLGDMYEVANIDDMLSVLEDTELISIYKSSIYENRLIIAMEELVDKGYVTGDGNKVFNREAGELGISHLKGEVTKRFGEENQTKILTEVDLSWDKNKPVIPTKRKKK